MAEKFHINSKGEPGKCSAQHEGCPFGGENDHYVTKEGASAAFERSMAGGVLATLVKAPTREQVLQTLDNMDRGSDEIPEGVEFVDVEPEVTSRPKTPVENLQAAIQDELSWADEALDARRKELVALKNHSKIVESEFGEESGVYDGITDADNAIHTEIREIEEYQRELNSDLSKVGKSWPSATTLRETLRERKLKKELNDLQYKPIDGNPSLKELEEKVDWPIRERDEKASDFNARVAKAGSQENEFSSLLAEKHAEESRIKAELDAEEAKRLETQIPDAARRNAKVDDAVRKNVVLSRQDEENLKDYNSFVNRASRLFKKKNVLTERARLDALPAGRKLIDYDPTDKKETVWTKTGHNSWVSENGVVSTDNERKLPAIIVE